MQMIEQVPVGKLSRILKELYAFIFNNSLNIDQSINKV